MMKNSKLKYILIIIFLLVSIGSVIYFYVGNNQESTTDTQGSRISAEVNTQNTNTKKEEVQKETKISTFSTTILDNSPGRLTNIRITCGILNGYIVNPGETFSFNNIVGEPTIDRGYQEAKIIINHKTETGIGGRKLSSK